MQKKTRKRRIVLIAAVLLLLGATSVFAATGEEYDPNEEASWVDVTFVADTPDDCTISLQIYWGGVPVRLSYNEDREDNGYSLTAKVAPGVHRIAVMSSSDTGNRYSYRFSDTLDTSVDREFHVLVIDEKGAEDPKGYPDEQGDGHSPEETPAPLEILPEELDFSGGKTEDIGRVVVRMKPCAAVESVVYTLSGETECDIYLRRDNDFEAVATVPAGEYREMILKEIELDEDVLATDYSFSFKHADHPDFYGWTYDVKAGEEVEIGDLLLMMNVNGTVTEADSGLLFASKLLDNREKAVDDHVMEELQENFPEDYPKETEMIPVYIPEVIEEESAAESSDWKLFLFIGLGAAVLIGTVVVIYKIHKIRKKFRDGIF